MNYLQELNKWIDSIVSLEEAKLNSIPLIELGYKGDEIPPSNLTKHSVKELINILSPACHEFLCGDGESLALSTDNHFDITIKGGRGEKLFIAVHENLFSIDYDFKKKGEKGCSKWIEFEEIKAVLAVLKKDIEDMLVSKPEEPTNVSDYPTNKHSQRPPTKVRDETIEPESRPFNLLTDYEIVKLIESLDKYLIESTQNITVQQYDTEALKCKELYDKKNKDYGESWRIMRPSSLTDQLFIKAKRIRSIEEKGAHKTDEGIAPEYIALVNYSIMSIMQIEGGSYIEVAETIKALMIAKNHDYGEAWRGMRVSSLTDLILMKIDRIKQIEDNKGKTIISEGIEAGYMDIANYALFALIRLVTA